MTSSTPPRLDLRPARPRRFHPTLRILVGLALAATAVGSADAGTTTGFSFLQLPAGARAAALGGAFTPLADDASALFWNPAGIAAAAPLAEGRRGGVLTAVHHESILGFRQDVVGGVYQKGGDGLSLALNTHYTESIAQRDALGNLLGDFGVTDFAVAAGYAVTASPGVRLGGAVQWTRETIAGDAASALAVSAGGLYAVPGAPGLALGLAVRNLGSSPSFTAADGGSGEGVTQPLTVAGGASWAGRAGSTGLLALAELSKLKGDGVEGRVGVEVAPTAALALRAGWMLGQDAADLTAGAGIAVGHLRFDYAFVPYKDDLGTSHRAGLSARF